MNNQDKKTILISEKEVQRKGGVVILPLREYQKLREQAVPIDYLEGKEAEELDSLVKKGLEEYHAGKCRTIKSLEDID